MVTVPKPPASRQSISPVAAVLPIALAKVWHGALRVQALASLPVAETQVRVSCAQAGALASRLDRPIARACQRKTRMFGIVMSSPTRMLILAGSHKSALGATRYPKNDELLL